MQTTDDGEYVPEKELDKNFKIPKRKREEDTSAPNINTIGPNYNLFEQQQQVLGSSYYNYGQPFLGQWPQPMMQAPMLSYPPNPPIGEPLAQTIYSTMSEQKEKPKNVKRDIYRETVPDVDDASLPKELVSMFQPLYCKLCSAQLSSNVMAKLHYKSKNHEKKIRKFLIEYSERTGEPLHKRAKMTPVKKVKEGEDDPKYFYCEVCDLPLTGKLHAESHYMGKNHQKAILGYRAPAGSGYYSKDGKWIRQQKVKNANGEEDTFGLDFRNNASNTTDTNAAVIGPVLPATSGLAQSKFYCDVCNIRATCQQQLEMHYNGQKHQKKLKQMGLSNTNSFPIDPFGDLAVVEGPCFVQLPTAGPPTKIETIDLTTYRTPSGQYYCHICNLTLNAEAPFRGHLQSKNHVKKSQQQNSK